MQSHSPLKEIPEKNNHAEGTVRVYYWCISEVIGMDFVKWARRKMKAIYYYDTSDARIDAMRRHVGLPGPTLPTKVEVPMRATRFVSHAPRGRR